MRLLKNILLFQKKIVFTSAIIAVAIGFIFSVSLNIIGLYYLYIAPMTHLFIYEIKNKNEYYYYYNLGLTKLILWGSTFVIALINLLILSLI